MLPCAWMLVGSTASGKSAVAQHLAEATGRVILSADSMLVYRGMDIGTAKPTKEERRRVVYFGVDVVDPDQAFSSGDFLREARRAWEYCRREDRELIVTGGTGLYFSALLLGLDAPPPPSGERRAYWEQRLADEGITALQRELASRWPGVYASLADPANPRRLVRALERAEAGGGALRCARRAKPGPLPGLWREPDVIVRRIQQRAEEMLDGGLIAETQQLLERYGELSRSAAQAIGYAEATALLRGEITRRDALERICARTRRLAKRQRTWFRHQFEVDWIEVDAAQSVAEITVNVEQRWILHGATQIILPDP